MATKVRGKAKAPRPAKPAEEQQVATLPYVAGQECGLCGGPITEEAHATIPRLVASLDSDRQFTLERYTGSRAPVLCAHCFNISMGVANAETASVIKMLALSMAIPSQPGGDD